MREVREFRSKLSDLGKPFSVIIYPGVGHAFANPSGGTYDARAADEAWRETVSFLKANLSTD
jgi:carboxymethylenebutenolidase